MSTSPALSSGMPKAQEATAARASSTDAEPGAVASTLTLEGSLRWWADDEDRQVRWKLDYHIVPWLFVTYLLAFLDRSNMYVRARPECARGSILCVSVCMGADTERLLNPIAAMPTRPV